MSDVAEEIRGRITKNSRDLYIARLPVKVHDGFKNWAQEEFAGDYGFALKHLWDFYVGLIPSGVEHLEAEIEQMKAEITMLKAKMEEKKEEKKEEKPRTRLDGGLR